MNFNNDLSVAKRLNKVTDEFIDHILVYRAKEIRYILESIQVDIPDRLLIKILNKHNYGYYDRNFDINSLPKKYRNRSSIIVESIKLNPYNWFRIPFDASALVHHHENVKHIGCINDTVMVTMTICLILILIMIWHTLCSSCEIIVKIINM